MSRALKYVVGTIAAVGILGLVVVAGVIRTGVYDIAANEEHLDIVAWALTTLQQNSVGLHARGITAPSLAEPERVRRGLVHYREMCVVCHGAPGVPRDVIGRGLNPPPPLLALEVSEWSDRELFWITRNGLKMTGMPSFSTRLDEEGVWDVVAYLRRQVRLSVREYEAMVRTVERGEELPGDVEWLEDDDRGRRMLLTRGEPARGLRLMDDYGCGACHVIPGLRGAHGQAGPPLTRFAERHYIAGTLLNTPEELVAWIVNPQAIEPGTLMPDLDVSPHEALDMAAYLFTLGEPPRALHTVRADLEGNVGAR